jgi:hypothetical protein
MPTLWLTLFLLILSTAAAAAQSAVPQLRDITVAPSGAKTTITFLFTGRVKTVVVEPKANGVAQVRMKSVKADSKALNSPLAKPGVRSVRAHIERTDVLVTNVTFTQNVASMTVAQRDSVSVVVVVKFSPDSPVSAAAKSPAKPTKKGTSRTTRHLTQRWQQCRCHFPPQTLGTEHHHH